MTSPELLIIVEIPKDKKVLCQAVGCGRAIYRRVHVVKNNGKIEIYGEDCSAKLFGKIPNKFSGINNKDEVLLTENDVEKLLNNTHEFLLEMNNRFLKDNNSTEQEGSISSMSDKDLLEHCLDVVKDDFRKKGIDPDLPGWVGFIQSNANKMFNKLKSQKS